MRLVFDCCFLNRKAGAMVYPKTDTKRSSHAINRSRARQMRSKPAALEKCFWSELRNRKLGGYKFKRQFLIGNYIVDFVCVEQKLVVELDGPFHAQSVEYDEARDVYLRDAGYRVMRFSNVDASGDIAVVLATVLQALKSGPA
jgi:very-short-patch-repair endonuclease